MFAALVIATIFLVTIFLVVLFRDIIPDHIADKRYRAYMAEKRAEEEETRKLEEQENAREAKLRERGEKVRAEIWLVLRHRGKATPYSDHPDGGGVYYTYSDNVIIVDKSFNVFLTSDSKQWVFDGTKYHVLQEGPWLTHLHNLAVAVQQEIAAEEQALKERIAHREKLTRATSSIVSTLGNKKIDQFRTDYEDSLIQIAHPGGSQAYVWWKGVQVFAYVSAGEYQGNYLAVYRPGTGENNWEAYIFNTLLPRANQIEREKSERAYRENAKRYAPLTDDDFE